MEPVLCRSPVPWAIGGLQHDASVYIALRTGLLQGDMLWSSVTGTRLIEASTHYN